MTAPPNEHDVSSSFAWDDRYRQQLEHLADTDEMNDDIRWPELKDAVKYMLRQTFLKYPSSSAPILHPAASLMASHQQQQRPQMRKTGSSGGSGSMSDGGSTSSVGSGSEEKTPPTGVAGPDGAVSPMTPVNGMRQGGADVEGEQSEQIGVHSLTEDAEVAASALNRRFSRAHERNEVQVREADMQAFFPSKRQAPAEWGGSWGKRIETQAELDKERRMVFGMLDDFEGQPPFTIQRLAELVLRPTEHHHTLPKYVSALKRLLSVTATRDAFPATTEEEEDDELTSVALDAAIQNGSATSSAGTATRSRSSSIAGSPRTAPLFSPIPFLMKSGDEGMPGARQRVEERREAFANGQGMDIDDGDVPTMELGGADRTTEHATEQALRSGAGIASNKAVHDAHAMLGGGQLPQDGNAALRTGPASENASSSTGGAEGTIIAEAATVATDASSVLGSAGLLANETPAASSTQAAGAEPLGVPSGPVDEVDQIGDKHGQLQPLEPGSVAGGARAFSSTTSSSVSPVLPTVANGEVDDGSKVASAEISNTSTTSAPSTETALDEVQQEGEERALKRVRSDMNLARSEADASKDKADE